MPKSLAPNTKSSQGPSSADAPVVPFTNKNWNAASAAHDECLKIDANDTISALGAAFATLEELNCSDAIDAHKRQAEGVSRRNATPNLEELLKRGRDRAEEFDKLPFWKKIWRSLQLP